MSRSGQQHDAGPATLDPHRRERLAVLEELLREIGVPPAFLMHELRREGKTRGRYLHELTPAQVEEQIRDAQWQLDRAARGTVGSIREAAYRLELECRACGTTWSSLNAPEPACRQCSRPDPHVRGIVTLYELVDPEG